MSKYIDGFLFVVPKGKEAEYRKMAQFGKKLWLKHGALDYKECIGDDLHSKGDMGGPAPLSFSKVIGAKTGETVWFSFIGFKSRKHRDQVNAKVMKDPAMQDPKWKDMPMPVDMKRFAYGGFKVEVGS